MSMIDLGPRDSKHLEQLSLNSFEAKETNVLLKMVEMQLSIANKLKVLEMNPEMKESLGKNYETFTRDAFNQEWRKSLDCLIKYD